MKVLITGGGGFLGYRLARELLSRDKNSRITLLDGAFPPSIEPRLKAVKGDIADAATVAKVLEPDTDAVFHLAAVVSGAAEADFDLGMRANLEGTRLLLERCRACTRPPRLVFASSVAAFGGELPEVLDDSTTPVPQTSYGTQKVIGEYLISDYSRKGYVDGRSLRLPTIVVRAGKPNAAASSFASGIIREPLNGVVSDCPVGPQTGIWLLSPRRVVDAFIHANELPASAWGTRRVVNLPGITATVAEMLEALKRVAGSKAAERVAWKPDARIQAIVATWPVRFRTPRALQMGFRPDADVESVIRDYIADEGIRLA
ncbi:MAG TPA: D-erythronate dehydrogenase [Burkholderiales bacterium]|nr:D-erythronate dehydrogenase [Burkholderiales bacterium]